MNDAFIPIGNTGWRDRMRVVGNDPLTSFEPYDYRVTYEVIGPRRLTPRERRQVHRWLRRTVTRMQTQIMNRMLGVVADYARDPLSINHTKRERCNQCGPVFCTCNAS